MNETMKELLKNEQAKDKMFKIALGIVAAGIARQGVQALYDKGVSAYRIRTGA